MNQAASVPGVGLGDPNRQRRCFHGELVLLDMTMPISYIRLWATWDM